VANGTNHFILAFCDTPEVLTNHKKGTDGGTPGAAAGVAQAHAGRSVRAHGHFQKAIEIAMKYALIAASIAAFVPGFGCAFAQGVNERREAPVAAPGQTVSEGQGGLRTSATPRKSKTAAPNAQAPETTARSLSREAGSDSSSEEESTAAEARRARDAVGRTLDRTHDLSQTASN